MRHLDIIKASKNQDNSLMIATITGNNFGDQIIEFRTYGICEKRNDLTFWGYITQSTVINCEGDHWSHDFIIKHGKQLYKKGK